MVPGLYSFAKNPRRCPGGIDKQINIKSRIIDYKKKNKNTPIIAFDYKASIQMFGIPTEKNVCCAGREKLIREKVENFFKILNIEFGCKLVFFLDGPIKEHKIPYYINKINNNYDGLEKFFNIQNGIQLNNENIPKNAILPIYYDNIIEIAKKYGEIHIAFNNENDLDIETYATDNKILAIFANDTDFVVMKGDYQIWLPSTINLENLTVDCLNKNRVKEVLQLNDTQMPIFATLFGNTIIPRELVQPLVTTDQFKVAKYIKKNYQHGIRTNDDIKKLSKLLYNNGESNLSMEIALSMVNESLSSYDIATAQINTIEPLWLSEHIKITNSTIVYIVRNDILFTMNIYFIPLNMVPNSATPHTQLILQLVLRQMGVILKDFENRESIKRKILYKPNHTEPFQISEFKPVFPNFNLPQLEHIIECSNENSLNFLEKIRLLSWLVSPSNKEIDTKILQNLFESNYFLPILILNYFVGENVFSIWEADAVLLTISNSIQLNIAELENYEEPTNFPARSFYVSNIYTESNYYFLNALHVCGLSKWYKGGHFDGFIFQKIYTEFELPNGNRRDEMMESLNIYRIYA